MKYSFVLPVYNRENLVKSALLSLINQSFSKDDYEIIVVNDNSSDFSENVIKKIIAESNGVPSIKYVNNDKNFGVGYSRNRGVRESNGEIIIQTEDDASYPPNYLITIDKKILELEGRQEKWGTLIVLPRKSSNFDEGVIPKFVQFRRLAIDRLTKQGKRKIIGGWIFKKSVYNEVGGYRDIKIGEDIDLVKKIKECGYSNLAIFDTHWSHHEPTSFLILGKRMFRQGFYYKDLVKVSNLKLSFKQKLFWFVNFIIFCLAVLNIIDYIFKLSLVGFIDAFFLLYFYTIFLIIINKELRMTARLIILSKYFYTILLLPIYYGVEIFGILVGRVRSVFK